MTDRSCPLAFLMAAAFASGLVWLCALTTSFPIR
jgi:hypothetical protein